MRKDERKKKDSFLEQILRKVICYFLIVGMVCSGFSYHVVFAAETTENLPTIRLYLQKPEGWGTPAFHIWNEDAVVKGDGEVFVPSWESEKTKMFKENSGELYYVDVKLKGWHGFQFIDAESDKEIKIDNKVDADGDVLAVFSQMREDTSVYYLEKNGEYGWYMDADGTNPLKIPDTIYANIHFYNECEWQTPCIDAWADGTITTYSNVGADTDIKGWTHKLPSMKAEGKNWYLATVQVKGELSGIQFVDAKTGSITMLDTKQLETIYTCTKKTATDVYYGYGTISLKKEDIPIPEQLVKRPSPIYNEDGTVTFHLATKEKEAGIKGAFTEWVTKPMEQVVEAEDEFLGFTTTLKVATEGGIYTYGMVTGKEEQWIGDPENKTETDNPVVVRNPEIGNGTVTIYWPSAEDIEGKVTYHKYGSKDNLKEVKFQPVEEAQNLYAAVIDKAEADEKYEYNIVIDGETQEDHYNFATKENGVTTFIPAKKITEPDYESPVIHNDGKVTFYYWNPSAKEVKLAGDMTSWKEEAVTMEKDTETGLFSTTIQIEVAGNYGYKFIVDGNWVLDEKNKQTTEGTDKSSLLEIKDAIEPAITPTMQATATIEPTIQAIATIEPTIQTTATIEPTIQVAATAEPTMQATATPTVQATAAIEPTIQVTATIEPAIQATATIEPTIQAAATVEPTIQATATIEPIIQATATINPTIQTTATVAPIIQATATINPTIQTTATVKPTITPTTQITETVKPTVTPIVSSAPAIIPTESPIVSCTITYVLNNGKNHKNNPFSYSTKDVNLKPAVRKGYTFAGWYRDKNYTEQITVIKASEQRDMVVYAKWNKVKKPTKIQNFIAKNIKGRKIRVSFKKVKAAKGYEILYARDRKFKKSLKKIYTTKNIGNIAKLKKKQTYYVKVRAYKIDSTGEKVYGAYTNIKKVYLFR